MGQRLQESLRLLGKGGVIMSDFIFFILLFISCVLGALTVKGIETLIKKKKAHRRYLKRLTAWIRTD